MLRTREIPITVPGATGTEDHVALIPILRLGLGMIDLMLELLGEATMHHIGMFRTKALMPVQY